MKQPAAKRRRSTARVAPSTPGTVDAWLDMLVSMLALPKAERQRIRDELEDHLRSRIDDLLITGLSEPEALQQAAAELGETADLARQLTHAHTTPRKRTYAMHAALIAIAGSIVAFGVARSGPNTLNNVPVLQDVPVVAMSGDTHPEHADTHTASSQPATADFAIDNLPFVEAFRIVADSFGLAPGLSATMLNRYAEHGSTATITGAYTLDEAMARLLSFDPNGSESNAYYIENGRVVITDPMVVIRRSLETRTYSLEWADINDHADLAMAVQNALANGPYSQLVSVNDTVGSLIVTARPEAQADVKRILSELHTNLQLREEARRDAAEMLRKQVKAEFERVTERWYMANEHFHELDEVIGRLKAEINISDFSDIDQADRKALADQLSDMQPQYARAEYELRLLQAQLEYLQGRMIEAEYSDLF